MKTSQINFRVNINIDYHFIAFCDIELKELHILPMRQTLDFNVTINSGTVNAI